jgi:hypothetical protein
LATIDRPAANRFARARTRTLRAASDHSCRSDAGFKIVKYGTNPAGSTSPCGVVFEH